MASLALIAVLKLTVGGTLWLGASALPLATCSDSDTCPLVAGVPTCPLEDGDGFDRVSLLAYSTKLATQRGMLQESTQVSPKLPKQHDMTRQSSSQVQQGASMGPKCWHAKCYACARALTAPPELGKRFHGNPADAPAPFPGHELLQAFEDEDQQDVIWRILPGAIPEVQKGGATDKNKQGGFCQEWYSLRAGVEDEYAKPASCFRKAGRHDVDLKVTSVQGAKLSPEDICNSCECAVIPGENPISMLPVTVDHLGVFQQVMEQKVSTTLYNVVAKVFSTIWKTGKMAGKMAYDFAANFAKGLANFVSHPITWLSDTGNQRVALKVLKFGLGVTLAVSAVVTGTALLGPAAAFAINAALSVAQAGHAYGNGATKREVAGMLVLSIGVGSITATVGIPDISASWLLPDAAAAIDGVAGATDMVNILDGSVPTESVTGLDAALGKATEAFDEAFDEAVTDVVDGSLKTGIKKAAGIYDSSFWKKKAAEEAQKKSNPSTLAEILKLQENLCKEAENEWVKSLQESVRSEGLPEGAPQVKCGILSGADIKAAAPSDVMAKYKPDISGTLEDLSGESVGPIKGAKKRRVSGAVAGSPEGAVINHAVSGAVPPLHGDAAIKDSVERETAALKKDPKWQPPSWGN